MKYSEHLIMHKAPQLVIPTQQKGWQQRWGPGNRHDSCAG